MVSYISLKELSMIFPGISLDGYRINAVFSVIFAFREEKSCPLSSKDNKKPTRGRDVLVPQSNFRWHRTTATFCPVFVPTVMENVRSSGLPPPFCPLSLTSLFRPFLAV